jgi:ABC-type nickel/cobalt efflux system permease component RcnA
VEVTPAGSVRAAILGLLLLTTHPADGAGFWSGLVVEIQAIQRDLHRQLAGAIRAVKEDGAAAASGLIVLSFLYGIFHAAGPGHGKIVISTYLLTQESHLRRGLLLSSVASLAQGVTAVLVVDATITLLGLSLPNAQGAATTLEGVSYALVALVGAMLVFTSGRRLRSRLRYRPTESRHRHDHADSHGHDEACSTCGHAHGPSRRDLDVPVSLQGLLGIIVSIGIRPCSGAILVLLVAHALDLRWGGIGAVLAMSLGVALTISVLAILSVYARKASLRLAQLLPGRAMRIAIALDAVAVIGGFLVLATGAFLLQAAWVTPQHPLM